MNSSNTAYLIQENTLKLQEVFESPVDVLREVFSLLYLISVDIDELWIEFGSGNCYV